MNGLVQMVSDTVCRRCHTTDCDRDGCNVQMDGVLTPMLWSISIANRLGYWNKSVAICCLSAKMTMTPGLRQSS